AISTIARGRMTGSGVAGCAALFVTNAASFMSDPALAFEVFGASSLIVRCSHVDEMARLLEALEGQLTVTFHMDGSDEPLAAMLLPIAARKAGRILANGWPTGVEVCDAMVHGGPFPATSNPLTTSVGTLAINRFLRPVCYQDLPDHLLPVALRRSNRWGLPRRINGVITLP
ncbi:MAG: aldehyde dehydrogenase, partial [Bradyrhizobium sp.]|nr:aldehyde dehydrogenase [Bradyrhizobium sp.]